MSIKVLHVIPSLGPLRGGPSLALPTMARGLAKGGVQVHVATTDDNGKNHLALPLGRPVQDAGITIRYFRRQISTYTISWPLARWLRQHVPDYDLLHIHSLFSYASTVAARCARAAGVPYIVRPLGHLNHWGITQRRRWIKQLSLRVVEHRLLQGAALIHYTTERERSQAREIGVDFPSFVLPLGIDHRPLQRDTAVECASLIEQYPILQDRFKVLFLSRLDPIKGLDLLLPAFAQFHRRHPATALIMAGAGEDRFIHEIDRRIDALDMRSAVVQTGFLDGGTKLAAMHIADVFVLPSYSENFANAPVEAMAAGVPVIVSDQVGVADAIRRANAGLVVTCHAGQLSNAMEALFNNVSLRRELVANGQQLVEDQLSVERTTRALIQHYESILRSRNRIGSTCP